MCPSICTGVGTTGNRGLVGPDLLKSKNNGTKPFGSWQVPKGTFPTSTKTTEQSHLDYMNPLLRGVARRVSDPEGRGVFVGGSPMANPRLPLNKPMAASANLLSFNGIKQSIELSDKIDRDLQTNRTFLE